MGSVDSNGLYVASITDPANPATLSNALQSSVSAALNSNVRPFIVTGTSERNALQVKRPASALNPLLVWRTDLVRFEMNEGSGWFNWPQSDVVIPPNTLTIDGTNYTRTGEFTVPTGKPSNWNTPKGTYYAYASFLVTRPYAPPSGWGFVAHVLGSSRYPMVSLGSPTSADSNSKMTVRYAQFGATSWSVPRIGWELVKLK